MIALLRSSPEIVPCQKTLVHLIFDLTFSAYVKAPGQTLNPDELREMAARDSSTEKEFAEATNALNSALRRLSQLGNRDGSVPASFSGHQEISQLSVLLNFVILTFRGSSADEFLLSDVLGFDGQGRLHLFVRLFNQMVDYWRLMPSGSPELLREKNEIHRDIFSTLHSIAVNTPSTLLTLLEEEFGSGGTTSLTSTSSLTSILTWMATGAQPRHFHSLSAATCCVQTWTTFLVYVMRSPQIKEAGGRLDIETLLFDNLKLSVLMHGATQLSFLLDMENPQHNKVCSYLFSMTYNIYRSIRPCKRSVPYCVFSLVHCQILMNPHRHFRNTRMSSRGFAVYSLKQCLHRFAVHRMQHWYYRRLLKRQMRGKQKKFSGSG